ncbi:MAG: hypothetical protein JNG89_06615 [Planctomycetaceae bacterium]|nr:hypothetical protein [Planctomycetaceae bacterium]
MPVPSDAQSPERQSADGVAETNSFSLQRDQPQSEERLRALYEAAPAGEERVAGEARAEELAGQSFDAYQVPVPVPEALWFKLQENEELLKEGEVDGRLPEQEQQPQTAAQQRRWSWYFAAPPLQGPPPAPDRIRAVILFVPDKSE